MLRTNAFKILCVNRTVLVSFIRNTNKIYKFRASEKLIAHRHGMRRLNRGVSRAKCKFPSAAPAQHYLIYTIPLRKVEQHVVHAELLYKWVRPAANGATRAVSFRPARILYTCTDQGSHALS